MKTMQENRAVWNVTFNSHIATIPGMRKLHYVVFSDSTAEFKFYSSSDVSRKERSALARMYFHWNWLLGLSLVYMKRIGG